MLSEINLSKRKVMILVLLLVGMAVQVVTGDDRNVSPCSEIFNYFLQDGVVLHGVLKVDSPDETSILLQVELSVGNHAQGSKSVIELGQSREDTIQNFLLGKPIMYRLNFPRWYDYPPKVTKVMLNGKQLCEGPPLDMKAVETLTTINLQHNLKLNLSPPGDNSPITVKSTTDEPLPPNQQVTVLLPPAPPKDWSEREGFQLNDVQCGITSNTNHSDIQQGQYPWLVPIYLTKSNGSEYFCIGNLISHKHVITAGQCLKHRSMILAPDKIFLRIGAYNLNNWSHASGSRIVGAEHIVVHPDFKGQYAEGDIALITLDEAIEYTEFIRPICLWREDTSLDHIVGLTGTVVGWGEDKYDNSSTREPRQSVYPIVSQEECLRSHPSFLEITSNRSFCAGNRNGLGQCRGNSGAGFIMDREGRWYLRGLDSISLSKKGSCDFSQYSVFTDVAKYLDWIRNNR